MSENSRSSRPQRNAGESRKATLAALSEFTRLRQAAKLPLPTTASGPSNSGDLSSSAASGVSATLVAPAPPRGSSPREATLSTESQSLPASRPSFSSSDLEDSDSDSGETSPRQLPAPQLPPSKPLRRLRKAGAPLPVKPQAAAAVPSAPAARPVVLLDSDSDSAGDKSDGGSDCSDAVSSPEAAPVAAKPLRRLRKAGDAQSAGASGGRMAAAAGAGDLADAMERLQVRGIRMHHVLERWTLELVGVASTL